MEPLSKEALRRPRSTRARRSSRLSRTPTGRMLEQRLAEHLTSLVRRSRGRRRLCPLGREISPLLAMEEARAVGAIVAFPAFDSPGKAVQVPRRRPARARAVRDHAAERSAPVVEPDLILVPLIAIDGHGTRLGRGKGHYDRALVRLKKSGARLIGVGWPLQRLVETIPGGRVGHSARRIRVAGGIEIFAAKLSANKGRSHRARRRGPGSDYIGRTSERGRLGNNIEPTGW